MSEEVRATIFDKIKDYDLQEMAEFLSDCVGGKVPVEMARAWLMSEADGDKDQRLNRTYENYTKNFPEQAEEFFKNYKKSKEYISFKTYDNLKLELEEVLKKYENLGLIEKENKELKNKINAYEEYGGIIDEGQAWADEAMASRKVLEKLKPILEFYANSKVGFERSDGTYAFYDKEALSEAYRRGDCYYTGRAKLTYDPNKAKEGLELIKSRLEDTSEVKFGQEDK